jgi:uncharacterized SAM-binding protein YcdF (DUF218 family)
MVPDTKKPRLTRLLISVFIPLILVAAAVTGWRGVGQWLVREDPLSAADVILVLSGSLPYRAEEAGKVFRMGYAPEVWVSWPESPADQLEKLGVRFVGEQEYNREILIHEGVPQTAVHILPHRIVDTEEEVGETAREMRRTGKTKVIIVTSPAHTRRVKTLWKKVVGENPKAIIRAAREEPFDADHWWRNTRDGLVVVREILGLLNAWAGLPVRPHAN